MPRVACWIVLLLAATVVAAQPPDRLGAVGDSLTDEYAEESYDYARSWTELLVEEAGLSFGPTAADAGQPGDTWGEPRRTGYEDNWARSGATIDDVLAAGQHTGVADGAVNRGVTHVTINIGVNDLSDQAYDAIYDGTWTQEQIDAWIAGRVDLLASIVDTITPTGAKVVLASVLDPSVTPLIRVLYPDDAGREAVAVAVGQWRDVVRSLAQSRGLVLLDQYALARAIFGTNPAPRPTLLVGNVAIDLLNADFPGGGDPTKAFVGDFFHPHTIIQAIAAATVATALNLGYGTARGAEMLSLMGGIDTLESEIGPLSDFVEVFTPIFGDGFESGDTSAWSVTVP